MWEAKFLEWVIKLEKNKKIKKNESLSQTNL